MKRILMMLGVVATSLLGFAADPKPDGGPYTETVDGIAWTFMVENGEASMGAGYQGTAVPRSTTGAITIPSTLGKRPVTCVGYCSFSGCSGLTSVTISSGVTSIGSRAFDDCTGLTSVTIPSSVTSIGGYSFSGCSGLTSVTIPSSVMSIEYSAFYGCSKLQDIFVSSANTHYAGVDGVLFDKSKTHLMSYPAGRSGSYEVPPNVTSIGDGAFYYCSGLTGVTIPSSVTSIGTSAFQGCSRIMEVTFESDAPATGDDVFTGTPADMVVRVKEGSSGWLQWNGRQLVYGGGGTSEVHLTVTNVVVHYILNSVQPEIAVPVSGDTGFVAVITEVTSTGAVSVPIEWRDNYPAFKTMYGNDFGKSLMMKSGKKDGAGNEMFVWQDYVAGTDPTDLDDKFTASITMVGDVPVISYSPELTAEQAALRTYKTFGTKQLKDEWTNLTDADGETLKDYNFFKVTVEMK